MALLPGPLWPTICVQLRMPRFDYRDGIDLRGDDVLAPGWRGLAGQFRGIQLRRAIRRVSGDVLGNLARQAVSESFRRFQRVGRGRPGVNGRAPAPDREPVEPQLVDLDARLVEGLGAARANLRRDPLADVEAGGLDPRELGALRAYVPLDLRSFLRIRVPPDHDPRRVLDAVRATWEDGVVELAYLEAGLVPPPGSESYVHAQRYLLGDGIGINAMDLSDIAGALGQGVAYADLEYGWTECHEDLPEIVHLGGENEAYYGHGTAVLGIISARHTNDFGVRGIAPLAAAHTVSPLGMSDEGDLDAGRAEAIAVAAATLPPGSVLLIEQQVVQDERFGLPAEVEPLIFNAIKTAVQLGIVVVEAAGNGGHLLDTYTHPSPAWGAMFTPRAHEPDAVSELWTQDSGAILVGAGRSQEGGAGETPVHPRAVFAADQSSVYGQRVDCYAWGDTVMTCGPESDPTGDDPHAYNRDFGGTSAAAAIVAGVALSVQGVLAARGEWLDGYDMRDLLRNGPGTPSQDPPVDLIGQMPDLRRILTERLGAVASISMRDQPGEGGGDGAGTLQSPDLDILERPATREMVAELFGRPALAPLPLRRGADHGVYLRVHNSGGAVARALEVSLYWAHTDQPLSPARWTRLEEALVERLALAPGGSAVVGPVPWPAGLIPVPGSYLLIAVVGGPGDPRPDLRRVRTFDQLRRLIRTERKIAWRNVEVPSDAARQRPGQGGVTWKRTVFAVGAEDRAREMTLELEGDLPPGAQIRVTAASKAAAALIATDAVAPSDGRARLAGGLLAAGAREAIELEISVPREAAVSGLPLSVRQVHADDVVGRTSWWFDVPV